MAFIVFHDIALIFAFQGEVNAYVNYILNEETAEGSLIGLLIRLSRIVGYRVEHRTIYKAKHEQQRRSKDIAGKRNRPDLKPFVYAHMRDIRMIRISFRYE